MAFVIAWRPLAVAVFWQSAVPEAASNFRHSMNPAPISGRGGPVCGELEQSEVGLVRLKRRADFMRVARAGRRFAAPGLVLQVADRQTSHPAGAGEGSGAVVGIGFTASKKVGNAVARNRAKRRLRAAVMAVMPGHAAANHDYVLIGRKATLQRPHGELLADLRRALRRTNCLVQNNPEPAPS
jgi:ribonuclease P protein component